MRKNSHDRILKGEPKKQHLSTIPKSCSIYIKKIHDQTFTSLVRKKFDNIFHTSYVWQDFTSSRLSLSVYH